MLLLDYARDVVGMPTRAIYKGLNIGWTTDETKRDAMVAAGATCSTSRATSGRVIGFEISFPIGTEFEQAAAA